MQEKYPSLLDRIQSTFIDAMVVIILMFAFSSMLDRFEHVPDWVRMSLFIGLFFIYEPLCTTMGATPGNYLKRIRVRKYSDTTKRLNIVQALIRYPVKTLLGWLSFLTINSNPERRAIHDLASGSVVIKL